MQDHAEFHLCPYMLTHSCPATLLICQHLNSFAFKNTSVQCFAGDVIVDCSLPFALCFCRSFAVPAQFPFLKTCSLCPRWTGTCMLSARSQALSNGLWKKVRGEDDGTALYSGYFCKNITVHWESLEKTNYVIYFFLLNFVTKNMLLQEEFGMWKTCLVHLYFLPVISFLNVFLIKRKCLVGFKLRNCC